MATPRARSLRTILPAFLYSLFFYCLALFVIVLALITPADLIYQSVRNNTLSNVISFAVVLVLTALVCLLLWATRFYTHRVVLRAIPKDYVAVDKGDVPTKVRKMIEREWRRCARIAWEGRPRDVRREVEELDMLDMEDEEDRKRGRRKHKHRHPHLHLHNIASNSGHLGNTQRRSGDANGAEGPSNANGKSPNPQTQNNTTVLFHHDSNTIIPLRTANLVWGDISHPGWSLGPLVDGTETSSNSKPIEYHTVVSELPHLLEARAVSLAPATALSSSSSSTASSANESTSTARAGTPDPRLVTVLQRPRGTSLRDYATRLLELGVISDEDVEYLLDFVDKYEKARFGARALTAQEFDALIAAFAELLNHMQMDLERITQYMIDQADEAEDEDETGTEVLSPSEDVSETGSSYQTSLAMVDSRASEDDGDDHSSVLIGY
jgi:hypothetical protein